MSRLYILYVNRIVYALTFMVSRLWFPACGFSLRRPVYGVLMLFVMAVEKP